jgi:hypothetical protein
MPDPGSIHVTIVDGRRQLLASKTNVLVRLLNGAKSFPAGWVANGGDITITGIPFTDTGRDAYNVFVHADGFEDAVTPNRVEIKPGKTVEVRLLAPPKDGTFHFQKWEQFQAGDPNVVKLLSNGASNGGQRYADTTDTSPQQLGALIDLATAINDIPLTGSDNPLRDYYWEVMWDMLAPDRFWAWVDKRLIARVKELADLHAFALEPGSAGFHPATGTIGPATVSWKQVRFEVANVQLTFHEGTTATRNGVDCVVIEPDIDLYKDLAAHGLTEVIPNLISGKKTDPRLVYAMRWMVTRQEQGVPEFNPPVTIE